MMMGLERVQLRFGLIPDVEGNAYGLLCNVALPRYCKNGAC